MDIPDTCLELLWFFLETEPTTNLPRTYMNLMVGFTDSILSSVTQTLATQSFVHNTSHVLNVPLHDGGGGGGRGEEEVFDEWSG